MNLNKKVFLFLGGIIFSNIILSNHFFSQISQFHRELKRSAQPTTNNQQPTTNNQQPTTNNQQPTTNNQQHNKLDCQQIKPFSESIPDDDLLSKFAYPLSEKYTQHFKQNINPDNFLLNAMSFFCHANQKDNKWKKVFIKQMISILNQHSVIDKGGQFFEYRFKYEFADYEMPIPWRSAFAQGEILEALILLDLKYPTQELKPLIELFFKSLIRNNRHYEVVVRDQNNYLWFDEMPLPGKRSDQSSYIINGHIATINGLYRYWEYSKNQVAKKLLDQAIETVKSNYIFFHVRGNINCYDLKLCYEDYSPDRIVKQMNDLFIMTSDPAFKIAQEIFKRENERFNEFRKRRKECRKSFFHRFLCAYDIKKILN